MVDKCDASSHSEHYPPLPRLFRASSGYAGRLKTWRHRAQAIKYVIRAKIGDFGSGTWHLAATSAESRRLKCIN